jgi:hypothetical protein
MSRNGGEAAFETGEWTADQGNTGENARDVARAVVEMRERSPAIPVSGARTMTLTIRLAGGDVLGEAITEARALTVALAFTVSVCAQARADDIWSGFAGNAQHTALSSVASQSLDGIRWRTPVDLSPQYTGNDLLIHYGSPLITGADTAIVPVKTGATD